jgi:hypothetical protein
MCDRRSVRRAGTEAHPPENPLFLPLWMDVMLITFVVGTDFVDALVKMFFYTVVYYTPAAVMAITCVLSSGPFFPLF